MIRPRHLERGDKIAIVSLSSGILGMPFCAHELEIGLRRLRDMGLEPVIMPNALRGVEYLAAHPEARAADLKRAFLDDDLKAILCAIGGDDTYRLIPHLMEDDEFTKAVTAKPKIFCGFSDTTMNHLMLYKLGLATFYGPALLPDIGELDVEMLPYTRRYFEKFFLTEPGYSIESSDIWYEERTGFGPEQVDVPRIAHREERGYEVLNGAGTVTGRLYGGCLESIYDAITGARYADETAIIEKYAILPTPDEWRDKLLFLETSEETPTPEKLETMLTALKDRGIFQTVRGIIVGKPMDEKYYEQYKAVWRKTLVGLDTPVLYNMNFGHATPRCVLPYGAKAVVDYDRRTVRVAEQVLM